MQTAAGMYDEKQKNTTTYVIDAMPKQKLLLALLRKLRESPKKLHSVAHTMHPFNCASGERTKSAFLAKVRGLIKSNKQTKNGEAGSGLISLTF